jgi:hypothetical protein
MTSGTVDQERWPFRNASGINVRIVPEALRVICQSKGERDLRDTVQYACDYWHAKECRR